jgi:hypothetical protein
MDFALELQACEDRQVGDAVLNAVNRLFERDLELLQLGVQEETITRHLANYLAPYFPDMNVDTDYNLMGEVPKVVTYDETRRRFVPTSSSISVTTKRGEFRTAPPIYWRLN